MTILIKLSFNYHNESAYETWVQMVKRFQSLKILTDDERRTPETLVYYTAQNI